MTLYYIVCKLQYMETQRPVTMNFRCPRKLHRGFVIKCKPLGTPSEVLRELMQEFVEGRIEITPLSVNPTSKEK